MLLHSKENIKSEKEKKVFEYVQKISVEYNIDKLNLLNMYFDYILRWHKEIITPRYLDYMASIMHSKDTSIENLLNYFVYGLMIDVYSADNVFIRRIDIE